MRSERPKEALELITDNYRVEREANDAGICECPQ